MPFYVWPSNINIVFSILVILIILGITAYIWQRRNLYGAGYFLVLCLTVLFWSTFYFLTLVGASARWKLLWENFEYTLLPIVPLLYLFFIVEYTSHKMKHKPLIWAVFLIEPLANAVVIWSNWFPNWFRTGYTIVNSGLDFPGYLVSTYGNWFWFATIYHYIFLIIDFVVLVSSLHEAPKWARFRYIYLLIGLFAPWVVAIFTIPHWITVYRDSVLILSMAGSTLLLAFGITRTKIFNILPIARETVLDQIGDVVFVIDTAGKVLDVNEAARKYVFTAPEKWLNQSFISILPELSALMFNDDLDHSIEIETPLMFDNVMYDFDIRITPLFTQSRIVTGWLAILHDITQRKDEERKLLKAEKQIEVSLKDLQTHSHELRLMQKTAETFNQASSIRTALLPFFNTIGGLADFDQFWVCLLDSSGQDMHREIFFDRGSESNPLRYSEDLPNNLPCLQDLIAGSIQENQLYKTSENHFFKEIHRPHFMTFPLLIGHKAIGLFNLTFSGEEPVSEQVIRQIDILSTTLSVTLDRVLMLKSTYSERRIAESFRKISTNLSSSLDLDNVLDLLLEQIPRLIPMDAGCVMMVKDENAYILRVKGYEMMGSETLKSINELVFPLDTTKNLQEVVLTKKPYIVADVRTAPDWNVVIENDPFRSWIGSPVVIDGDVFLIFALTKAEPNFYTIAHSKLLTDFCAEVALSIQNSRLYESEKKRIRELESMQITLNDISSELDVQKLLHSILDRALLLLDTKTGMLALYREDKQIYEVVVGFSQNKDLSGLILAPNEGLLGEVCQKKKPLTVDHYASWNGRVEKFVEMFPNSLLEVPLLTGDQVMGVLIVGATTPKRQFTEDDIRLLSLFGQQAIVALKNTQLLTEARQKADEAETLRHASAIVASTLKQNQAMGLILDQLQKVVPYDSASILLVKDDHLELVEGHGFTENATIHGMKIPLDIDQPGPLVFREKKPLVVNDMQASYPSFYEYNHQPISSWIGVPLIVKNRTIGILSLDSLENNRYTENHARLVSAFADQVAIALENIRLYEDAVRSANKFSSLYTLSQSISANLQPQNVFHAIYRAASELMPCDIFMISLYDEEKQLINDVYSIENGVLEKPSVRPFGEGIFSKVIRENRSLLYNHFTRKDVTRTKAVLIGNLEDETLVQSIIVVPLRIGRKIKGVLSTQSYDANKFTEENKETLEMLATHSAIALENARLFNEIQELAMTDPLTKIFNRRKFYELAEGEFERARRYQHPLSVIMMDIDKFKQVNDTYGHSVGDLVLTRIAELCNSSMRSIDILARYGGEEFVAMLPETTVSEAQLMAERLRQLVARTPIMIGSASIKITLSFGVVELENECKTIEELMDRSDQAMYASKNSGRNRVTVWSARMGSHQSIAENHFHPD